MNFRNVNIDKYDYFRKVLYNLKQIESASYYLTSEYWAPGNYTDNCLRWNLFYDKCNDIGNRCNINMENEQKKGALLPIFKGQ